MPRLRRLLLLAALLAAAAIPAAASAAAEPVQTDTASLGTVTATFTHQDLGNGKWGAMRITITRGGVVAYDAAPDVEGCGAPYCAPGSRGDSPSIAVADVDADGEPEVIADFYTGGAHCCVVAHILRYDGTGYVAQSRNFGDGGYSLEPGAAAGDPMTFVTGDHRFAYAFAPFAFSRFPVRLLTFTSGRWKDVTTAHPETLRADAADLMAEYRRVRKGRESLGILAAWVADQWRLGRRVQAYNFLTRELHAGRLKGYRPWPKRLGYIASLTRYLSIWGYDPRLKD